jgi:hypothetical protein
MGTVTCDSEWLRTEGFVQDESPSVSVTAMLQTVETYLGEP